MPGLRTAPDESGFKPPSGGAVPSPAIHRRAGEAAFETPSEIFPIEGRVQSGNLLSKRAYVASRFPDAVAVLLHRAGPGPDIRPADRRVPDSRPLLSRSHPGGRSGRTPGRRPH